MFYVTEKQYYIGIYTFDKSDSHKYNIYNRYIYNYLLFVQFTLILCPVLRREQYGQFMCRTNNTLNHSFKNEEICATERF